jgi:galactonate dehydratase
MTSPIASVEVFSLTQARDTPYLGALRSGEVAGANGYVVRRGNRTVYPTFDRSVLVRITTGAGTVGWGETYGIVAPGAVAAIINDLLAGFVIGRTAENPSAIHDDLYDMMRVRGYNGGFYVDALAAIDIALWDIAGREAGLPLVELLGGGVATIPAYVSGLPERIGPERAALARRWQDRGFDAFKFATPVADDGPAAEIAFLRATLGPTTRIAADMHWNQTAEEALALIAAMASYDPWFVEAPVWPEDIDGLARVSYGTDIPVAVGEEWRTVWDMRHRIGRCRIAIVQPEMGHMGVTCFRRIGALATEHGIEVIPHATIGAGIFLAASLHTAATLPTLVAHEFQHSIFEPNRRLLDGDMDCREGFYHLPGGSGLGVRPSEEALRMLQRM